ncbi:hypothetical protein Tco_0132400 [Tanacetum coccineum]
MSNYLKHQGSWTSAQLKKLSDEEIKAKYERLVRSIANFVPIGAEERVKRLGPELQSDTSKKQKTTEVKEVPLTEDPKRKLGQSMARKRKLGQSTAKEDEEHEKEKEELSMFFIITFDEYKEVDYEILDQRSPIIAWNSDKDDFWKSQEKWNIMSWKLHKSTSVHTLETDTEMVIHMLVEKKYPLMKKVLL